MLPYSKRTRLTTKLSCFQPASKEGLRDCNVSTTASSWHSHNGRDLCQQGPMQNVPACCSQQAYAASTHPHLKLARRVLSRTLENTKEDTTHYTGAKRSLGTAWTSAMHLSKNNIPRTARVEPVQKPAMMAFHGSSF